MSRGLVLGKFMPPHRGHQYLIDFARAFADEVTIVVGSLAAEPIPGTLRHQWMKELFPSCRVVHLTDENPQHPEEHPDFWSIWRNSLQRIEPGSIDYLFASEGYGARLAAELGAVFIPTAGLRESIPVSATQIRRDPRGCWEWLPAPVRRYYLRRISIFGPESTGKSTLAARLAEYHESRWVPEYARTWLELKGPEHKITLDDMRLIARGQRAAEEALVGQAHRYLFCDTDPLACLLWSEALCGEVASGLAEVAFQAYDLTLLLDVDVPWRDDPVRYFPEDRKRFLENCRCLLETHNRPYHVLSGSWDERWQEALDLVSSLP